jgi:malonate decarboxylase gamma subunit
MTLDEVLKGLFPSGHDVKTSAAGIITGTGKRKQGEAIAVGVANGVALGTAGVLPLAEEVLRVVARGGNTPILVLVDTSLISIIAHAIQTVSNMSLELPVVNTESIN